MTSNKRRILVTGANGFIAKNLIVQLQERGLFNVVTFTRGQSVETLPALVADVDGIIHLAGINRPQDPAEFAKGNTELTEALCDAVRYTGRSLPIIIASSSQAALFNDYGRSKRAAEEAVEALQRETGNPAIIFRLPGVFGKWCKPNYNSVVATFCYNIAHDLPIQMSSSGNVITLVYVDDVVAALVDALDRDAGLHSLKVAPEYSITVGELAVQVEAFKNCRSTLISENVGTGLSRALYATYVSYLPTEKFVYDIPSHGDSRGVFVEMLKTPDAGQFSYFTAHPGITRGSHYHHTKTEKFLVIKGHARFGFRHIVTNESYQLETRGETPQIVETVPGWTHDVTNIGGEEMVVMLWANEIFDHANPDTIACKV